MRFAHLAPVLVTGCFLFLSCVAAPTQADDIAHGHRLGVHTQPNNAQPTFGHGLGSRLALDGWIALYDGETTFGWTGANTAERALYGGRTTTVWKGRIGVRVKVIKPGRLVCGKESLALGFGTIISEIRSDFAAPLELADGLAVTALAILPEVPSPADATWRVLKHSRNAAEKQTRWSFSDGRIRAVGGPGCIELQSSAAESRAFGDFILQAEVTTHRPLTNGGIFFRAIAGDFMNGYEAQVFNGCLEEDALKPSTWSTGAIDDRMNARRVVSRDGTPFYYTIHASGPHIAVWINGFQQVDWTDDRPEDDNARKGRRTRPGALQLQAHDPETDVEFANIRLQSLTPR